MTLYGIRKWLKIIKMYGFYLCIYCFRAVPFAIKCRDRVGLKDTAVLDLKLSIVRFCHRYHLHSERFFIVALCAPILSVSLFCDCVPFAWIKR